jgi:uncharacterized protein
MNSESRFLALAVALVVSTCIGALAWTTVKLSQPTTIDVRGSAKKRIVSDLAEWAASVSTVKNTRVEASVALKKDVEQVTQFLKDNGVKPESIRASAIDVVELSHEETLEEGTKVRRVLKSDGWSANQRLEVSSTDVERIERLSREATSLLEKGIVISSPAPSYLYTKHGELKIEMLAEASKDARLRAEKMLESAGGGAKVGRVMGIDTGVININAANSTETSWEGNFDTSSYEKDIITTVRVRFEVKN